MQTASLSADGAYPLVHGGVRLSLLPQRAVLLEDARALLVADVHLGKAASFRALGVPVPEGTTTATLLALDALVRRHAPALLCVLGDLLHAPAAQAPLVVDALASWRSTHPQMRVLLVRGNHDDRAGDPPPHCGIEVVDDPFLFAGLALRHAPPGPSGDMASDAFAGNRSAAEPVSPQPGSSIAGHLHPVATLASGADRVRLPCFFIERECLVLPAFGEFTGGWAVESSAGVQVYLTDGQQVHRLPARRVQRARMR